jgi:hypothetical protein
MPYPLGHEGCHKNVTILSAIYQHQQQQNKSLLTIVMRFANVLFYPPFYGNSGGEMRGDFV